MKSLLVALAVLLVVLMSDAQDAVQPSGDPLAATKQSGWSIVSIIADGVKDLEEMKFPGHVAWFAQFRKATKGCDSSKPFEQWPVIDSDVLVTRNPVYWQMHFEAAPADAMLLLLHAGLLKMSGETLRSSYVLVIASQLPHLTGPIRDLMLRQVTENNKAIRKAHEMVNEGIALHDKGDFDSAVARYDATIKLFPKYSLAWYERGYSLRSKAWKAAGIDEKKQPGIQANSNLPRDPVEVTEAYAKARQYDPFQVMAYQGSDQKVIAGFMAMSSKGMPAWKKLQAAFASKETVDEETLQSFAEAMQTAGAHDLAIVAQQVIVARRGGYVPKDYPLLEKSLRALATGEPVNRTLGLLRGDKQLVLKPWMLTDPASPRKDAAKQSTTDKYRPEVADVDHITLLVPTTELQNRLSSVDPFAEYVKGVSRKVDQIMAVIKPGDVKAKGMIVTVGIKARNNTRVWCEAVDGEIPVAILQQLERELAKLEAIDPKMPPMAFSLNIKLYGRAPGEFAKIPNSWKEAARKHSVDIVIPPDDLFKHIWPE